MHSSILALMLAALSLSACGKEPQKATEVRGEKRDSSSPPVAADSWEGRVEKIGVSITMQGTHKLVAAGKTVALLQSTKVDLSKYEGKKVRATGASTLTVEGNQTLVTVEAITDLP